MSLIERRQNFLRFLAEENSEISVDSSRTGELHLHAMCYVYDLWPQNVMLKLANVTAIRKYVHDLTLQPFCTGSCVLKNFNTFRLFWKQS